MSSELRRKVATEMDAGQAVLEAAGFSRMAGFDETRSQMIATAVSELARNILKYAGSGEIRLRQVRRSSGRGVEVRASDHGPGIDDPQAALRDHFSTGGSLGLGLPGVKRMMDEFSLESTAGEGTHVTTTKWI